MRASTSFLGASGNLALLLFTLGLVAAGFAQNSDREIRTPPPPATPRINGPTIYGAHPGHPFLYRIPATGVRPLRFSAKGLPKGLVLDPETGIISGSIQSAGKYVVQLHAANAQGKAERSLRIVIGDTLALTPPMGWSTWYMAYTNISQKMVLAQADGMIASGLADHGYSYINIDDGWNRRSDSKDPALGPPTRDAHGNLLTNANFPDLKAMTDTLHSKGLKSGIYIGPGPRTCAGFEGSYQHEQQDAQQFAAWGFDFLKYDLCSYADLMKDRHNNDEAKKPYQLMGSILAKLDRDFVFNLCEYGWGDVSQWGRQVGGNYWRTTDDVGAGLDGSLWKSMDAYGFGEAGLEKYAGPGGWNDPDNIMLGNVLWKDQLVPTPLTPNEQYTWMTLWSVLDAPLIFAGDMTQLDEFTLNLITNDEVIAVNQDVLGKQGVPVSKSGKLEVWAKPLEDGSKAVGLFNRGQEDAEVIVHWSDLSFSGERNVRDLWRQKDLGKFKGEFRKRVAAHGAEMIRVW
jgi:alpha-galactosidase